MRKPNKQLKRPRDISQWAHQIVEESTSVAESVSSLTAAQLSAYMAEIGSKGGKIGGKRRLSTMTAKERTAVAKKAALTRWRRKDKRDAS
jgi:hypothetical protein